ncbi:hypothetical protein PIN31009_01894 [Pandoraea iniqua]|uniref:hypothetical protein n=1 Tax=Pandoraea iniqua TaxID=2508288 RepID=UPI00123FD148|nr:hypothetical protein [Pandoraea iniqua]VVD96342.1 hypothetical protein PIN31009_01894 [Pandoraea iniqua]
MSTRREALETALEAVEQQTAAPSGAVAVSEVHEPAVEVAAQEQADERQRDEAGRFSPKQPDPAAVAADTSKVDQMAPPEAKARPAAPQSWKAEHRAKWDTLDPEVAAYINQREEETARGVEPLKRVWKEVLPYMEQIQASGATPEYVINDLMRTYNTLRNGDPQTKLQTLMNVAQACGIQLPTGGEQQQQYIDPNIQALQQQMQGLNGVVSNFQYQQQVAQAAAVNQQIEQFKASHEHFDAVQDTMARLLTAGEANDLDSAYTKAIRLHDDIFQRHQASQREADEARKRQDADKAAKAARANTVSTRSATPGNVAAKAGVATGRRAALEEAFNEIGASRL